MLLRCYLAVSSRFRWVKRSADGLGRFGRSYNAIDNASVNHTGYRVSAPGDDMVIEATLSRSIKQNSGEQVYIASNVSNR